MDITAALLNSGITTPLPTLYAQIEAAFWTVKSVKFDNKRGCYVAVAENPHGERMEKTGNDVQTAVGNILSAALRRNYMRTAAQWKVGSWKMFTDQLQPIAEAYAKAPVYDQKAAAAFMELAADSVHRAQVIGQQIKVEVTDNPEPYPNAAAMCEDIHKRRHFVVSRANSEHPLWSVDQNVAFRTVHDVLGHAVSGGDFGWQGENLACAAHAPLLSSTAQQALFSECIGQTAYAAYYRGFGPQKVALFPQFTNDTQDTTPNQGIHPSQSLVPVSMPSIPQSPPANTPYKPGDPAPHQLPGGLTNMSRLAALVDPNVGWTPAQSGILPLQPNAYLDHGDPMQGKAVMDNARLIDTEWAYLKDGAGKPDYARMKLAVENAFRVALLSPLKDLRWNAIHYQGISHVPAGTNNPDVYWNTLDKQRQEWNVSRFGEDARFAHLPYHKAMKQLGYIVYKDNPQLGYKVAEERTTQMINDWRNISEQEILAKEQLKKESKRKNATQVELAANAMIAKHIKLYIAEKKAQHDVERREQQQEPTMPMFGAAMPATTLPVTPTPPATTPTPDLSRYGGFMYGHLVAISRVSENIDTIMKAALEDVHDHDGAGHHFRATVLQLGIPGVAPKVASFIWLLLQPMTSQLGTIDTHMMDVLGHDYDADMSKRDYFKYERELAAGRDAAGYGHIPLGAFQWGMWDYKRTGAGSHQDHSAMRVLDPKPHDTIDWAAKAQPQNAGNAQQFKQDWRDNPPDWWANTKAARDAVAQEYDQQMMMGPKGKPVPRGKIPYQSMPDPITGDPTQPEDDDGTNPNQAFARVAARGFDHWWDHEQPITEHKAHILGEYAAGCKPKLSHSDLEDFLDDHRSDVEGDFEAFKHTLLDTFRKYRRESKVAGIAPSPWFVHPLTGVHLTGAPGQPLMHHITQNTGWSTPDIWQGIQEAGKASA